MEKWVANDDPPKPHMIKRTQKYTSTHVSPIAAYLPNINKPFYLYTIRWISATASNSCWVRFFFFFFFLALFFQKTRNDSQNIFKNRKNNQNTDNRVESVVAKFWRQNDRTVQWMAHEPRRLYELWWLLLRWKWEMHVGYYVWTRS